VGRTDGVARCLDGIFAGSELPREVVVVDQSGREDVAQLLDQRAALSVRLLHIAADLRGLSSARNVGARAASGDVFAFTDDDCVPDRDWIRALAGAFSVPDAPAAVTGPMLPLPGSAPGLVAVSSRTSLERREFVGRGRPWEIGTGGNVTLSREWFDRVGGFDERLGVGTPGRAGEDLDLFRRLLDAGGRIVYEPTAVCGHEQKTPGERRARRSSYGMGAGAALGLWLRGGDLQALTSLAGWVSLRVQMALRGSALDELRVLGGTVRGVSYGLRLRPWR